MSLYLGQSGWCFRSVSNMCSWINPAPMSEELISQGKLLLKFFSLRLKLKSASVQETVVEFRSVALVGKQSIFYTFLQVYNVEILPVHPGHTVASSILTPVHSQQIN